MLEAYGDCVYNKLKRLSIAAGIADETTDPAAAEREANPFNPVPKLMTRAELEQFYYAVMEEPQ